MRPLELAKIYMMSFTGIKPLGDLISILAEDVNFTGPFYSYNNAEDYIQSLRENRPINDMSFVLVKEFENENSCCLVYQFKQQAKEEVMAQLFEIHEEKITKIRLILDASHFLKH